MKTRHSHPLLAALLCVVFTAELSAQTTAFTYHGELRDNGLPASGVYDLRFTIYNVVSGGSAVAGPLTNAAVSIRNGLFTVALDFGSGVFTGADRWLEIGVRTNGVGQFNSLSPRHALTPVPTALDALTPAGPQGPEGPAGPQGAKGLNWLGAWSGLSNYPPDDAVFYNGSAWVSLRTNLNVSPSEGADWTILAQQGTQGPRGSTGSSGPPGPMGTIGSLARTCRARA